MNSPNIYCRWPPVYCMADLGTTIKESVNSQEIFSYFYSNPLSEEPHICQGDIVELETAFPYIDEAGDVAILEDDFKFWIVLGNTCDFARDVDSVKYTHLSPVIPIDKSCPKDLVYNLKHYQSYKKFYIPEWKKEELAGYLVDFSMMCSVHKEVFTRSTNLVTRLGFRSWVLLHSCLVRYLARDDGRHE